MIDKMIVKLVFAMHFRVEIIQMQYKIKVSAITASVCNVVIEKLAAL